MWAVSVQVVCWRRWLCAGCAECVVVVCRAVCTQGMGMAYAGGQAAAGCVCDCTLGSLLIPASRPSLATHHGQLGSESATRYSGCSPACAGPHCGAIFHYRPDNSQQHDAAAVVERSHAAHDGGVQDDLPLTWPAPSAQHTTQWPLRSITLSTYAMSLSIRKGTSGMRHTSTTPAAGSSSRAGVAHGAVCDR
jgi:hypothetical protein